MGFAEENKHFQLFSRNEQAEKRPRNIFERNFVLDGLKMASHAGLPSLSNHRVPINCEICSKPVRPPDIADHVIDHKPDGRQMIELARQNTPEALASGDAVLLSKILHAMASLNATARECFPGFACDIQWESAKIKVPFGSRPTRR